MGKMNIENIVRQVVSRLNAEDVSNVSSSGCGASSAFTLQRVDEAESKRFETGAGETETAYVLKNIGIEQEKRSCGANARCRAATAFVVPDMGREKAGKGVAPGVYESSTAFVIRNVDYAQATKTGKSVNRASTVFVVPDITEDEKKKKTGKIRRPEFSAISGM